MENTYKSPFSFEARKPSVQLKVMRLPHETVRLTLPPLFLKRDKPSGTNRLFLDYQHGSSNLLPGALQLWLSGQTPQPYSGVFQSCVPPNFPAAGLDPIRDIITVLATKRVGDVSQDHTHCVSVRKHDATEMHAGCSEVWGNFAK